MPNNFFISGMPKSGKTTAIRRLIKELESQGYAVGGFVSPEIKEHGTREGFYVEDIATGKTALLASITGEGPKISKYHVNVGSFEDVALECLRNAKKYDVLVIDEIGRMELESVKFGDVLEEILRGPKPVIASLHSDFVHEYENFGRVYAMTDINRNAVEVDVLNSILQVLGKRKKVMEKARAVPAKKETPKKAAARHAAKPIAKRKEAPKPPKRKPKAKAETAKAVKKEKTKERKGLLARIRGLFRR